jgi:serine/threonine protein kinase
MKATDFDEFPRALRDDEPQVADVWKLIHVIGEGGMGKVYGGVLKDKTYAAIKMISSENLTPTQLSRFNKEIDAMKLVNSTHIAKLLGASTSNEPPYIAIEYIYGKTFKDLIANRVEITEKDWYNLARQVFYALREIHLRGLTHRDISPGNIMKLNDVKQIKIIDFGLSMFDYVQDPTQPRVGCRRGSHQYVAFEIVAHRLCTKQSDIFSLGLTIMLLLGLYDINDYITNLTRLYSEYEANIQDIIERNIPFSILNVFVNVKDITQEEYQLMKQNPCYDMINSMVLLDRKNRPTIDEVLTFFKDYYTRL